MNIFNMGPKDDSRYGFEKATEKGDNKEVRKILNANEAEATKIDLEIEKAEKQFDQDVRKYCDALIKSMGGDYDAYQKMKIKMKQAIDDNMGWS